MKIRPAGPADSQRLCTMLERAPMGEQIRLTFERRPGYFQAASVQAEEPEVYTADTPDGGRAGVFATGRRRVFIDGTSQSIRYLSDLRIDPAHRGGRWLLRGYRHLREHVFAPGEFGQTLVLTDNATALALLTSRRPGLPYYHAAGTYLTHFVACPQRTSTRFTTHVRRATAADLPEMQAFIETQGARKAFFPAYDLHHLGSHPYYRNIALEDFHLARDATGHLTGMLGVWDQSPFKQTRVRSYAAPTRWALPLSRWITGVPLPRPGETLPLRYLHTVLIRNDDPVLLDTLVDAVLKDQQRRRWTGYLVTGLDASDPLNQAFVARRKRTVEGRHFLVSFDESPPPLRHPFYFECARI